jgi:hypothetical protein
MADYESDQQLLAELGNSDWQGYAGIVILMEAWMPPLVSFQTFLQDLRHTTDAKLPILLRLVGKPTADTALTPVQDQSLKKIWQQKTACLGDAYLDTASLIDEQTA